MEEFQWVDDEKLFTLNSCSLCGAESDLETFSKKLNEKIADLKSITTLSDNLKSQIHQIYQVHYINKCISLL